MENNSSFAVNSKAIDPVASPSVATSTGMTEGTLIFIVVVGVVYCIATLFCAHYCCVKLPRLRRDNAAAGTNETAANDGDTGMVRGRSVTLGVAMPVQMFTKQKKDTQKSRLKFLRKNMLIRTWGQAEDTVLDDEDDSDDDNDHDHQHSGKNHHHDNCNCENHEHNKEANDRQNDEPAKAEGAQENNIGDLETGIRSGPEKLMKTQSTCDSIDLDDASPECQICLVRFEIGEDVCLSNNPFCRHVFHKGCMEHWLLQHEVCPVCREVYLLRDIGAKKVTTSESNQ